MLIIPKKVKMNIQEIAENITIEEFAALNELIKDKRDNIIKEKVKAQLPSIEKIYSSMSENQFFEQVIEIDTKLKVKFRTITDACRQDPNKFKGEANLYHRTRLSHSLLECNGKSLTGGESIDISYWTLALSGTDVTKKLNELATKRASILSVMDNATFDKILTFYNTWEFLIYSMINDMDIVEISKN